MGNWNDRGGQQDWTKIESKKISRTRLPHIVNIVLGKDNEIRLSFIVSKPIKTYFVQVVVFGSKPKISPKIFGSQQMLRMFRTISLNILITSNHPPNDSSCKNEWSSMHIISRFAADISVHADFYRYFIERPCQLCWLLFLPYFQLLNITFTHTIQYTPGQMSFITVFHTAFYNRH